MEKYFIYKIFFRYLVWQVKFFNQTTKTSDLTSGARGLVIKLPKPAVETMTSLVTIAKAMSPIIGPPAPVVKMTVLVIRPPTPVVWTVSTMIRAQHRSSKQQLRPMDCKNQFQSSNSGYRTIDIGHQNNNFDDWTLGHQSSEQRLRLLDCWH